jgi:nucleosome assembly protein 1-like 1
VLEITVQFDDGGEDSSVIKTEATEIEWLEGKDTTKKKIKKKQKHKKSGETRTVMKTVDAESFFNLF